MWFYHHCLAWHATCSPQSWVDAAELVAGCIVIVAAVAVFWGGLLLFLEWLNDLY